MNSFELITKYLPQAVDKYFYEDAKTAILEQGSKFIDVKFDQTGYVKIASMLMDGLSDYYRTQNGINGGSDYAAYEGNVGNGYRDGFAIGGTTIEWEIFKLQYCRGKQFRIDYIDDEETAGIVIGNAVEEFNRTKVIPEVDASRFSLIADTASVSLGNLKVDSIAANSIIGNFNNAFEWLSEHEVPEEDQVIFVNPSVMTLIRNTTELAKFITQGDYKNAAGLDFTVEKYAGRPIIQVPSNRFFTNVLLNENGFRPQASLSKVINYMVVSTKAVVPIRKLEWSKIYGPEMSGLAGFHGYLINYLIYHGVVIPKNKIVGCYVNVSETGATTKANLLSVDTRAGSASNHWVLNNYFTNPAGLRGFLVAVYYNAQGSGYAKDGFVLGDTLTGTAGSDYFVVNVKNDYDASTSTKAYFALVDASGKFIAVTGEAITLAKKA